MPNTIESLSEDLAQTVDRLKPHVVMVGGDHVTPRTGVVLPDGMIATIAMEATAGESVPVATATRGSGAAEVKSYWPKTGLALLERDGEPNGEPVELGGDLPLLGSLVITVAYPSPDGYESRLSSVRCVDSQGSYIQTDGAAYPGFAGAPVFSPGGRFVGITMLGSGGNDSWILPVARLSQTLTDGAEASVPAGWLGVSCQEVPLPEAVRGTLASDTAALVVDVAGDSPAEHAGITFGDVIVSVAGNPVSGPMSLASALQGTAAGSETEIVVVRAGSRVPLSATLAALPEGTHSHDRPRHGGGKWRRWASASMMG